MPYGVVLLWYSTSMSTSLLEHSTLKHSVIRHRKKALLIGIQYYEDAPEGGQIKGPHLDVQNMCQLLLGNPFLHNHVHGL
jgi:hypothetical protein